MQYVDQTKTLFQLTTELTDKKVEIAVVKSISEVVDQIIALKQEIIELRAEMHREINSLRNEMIERFAKVESRLAALETAVYRRNQNRSEVRTRLYDVAAKAGWLLLGSGLVYLAGHFHISIQ